MWTAFLLAHAAPAQTPGTCAPATASALLDVNNVRARILNNGPLFWPGGPSIYEVPKDSGAYAIYTAGIWVGGRVAGPIRTAAALYGRYEFWPGPLDAAGNPPADCTPFDRIYEITRDDLQTYDETGIASPNVAEWPWHLGAPVLDGDGDPANYNLQGGDRPALVGDQMLWWVMNDAGGPHETTASEPIGLEVHGSAFSYSRPAVPALDNTTFYRYVLRYKGAAPLEDAYVGLWIDADLGNFDDDLMGSDTTLHLGYFYNADNFDEGGGGYGEAPPAVGATFLRGARLHPDGVDNNDDGTIDEPGERGGMTAFVCLIKTRPPEDAAQVYNHLRGLLRQGDPQTVGGTYGDNDYSDTPTRFCFPGDPVAGAFWSMENMDDAGRQHNPHDVRFLMSTGPFTMQPGDTEEIAFAIVWARGADRLASVAALRDDVAAIRRDADHLVQPGADLPSATPSAPPAYPLHVGQNYPNPFREATTIRYSLPRPMHVRLAVYDLLGREVAMLVDGRQAAGTYEVPFAAHDLPGGVYVYRIAVDHLSATRRMLLLP